MKQEHRDIILVNISNLQEELDYDRFSELCLLRNGLYFEEMRSKIERTHSSSKERLKALLVKLTHRGPKAFDIILDICKKEFHGAYEILIGKEISLRVNRNPRTTQPKESTSYRTGTSNVALVEFVLPLSPSQEIKVKKATHFQENDRIKCYKMRSRNRGVAFIVNIINFKSNSRRDGASIDRDNLVSLWREMGFLVYYYEDITKQQFDKLLQELAASEKLRDAECLVFFLMTHGSLATGIETIEFSDSTPERVDNIIQQFSNEECPNMLNKPKVFFFPFCRSKDSKPEIASNHVQVLKSANRTSYDGALLALDNAPPGTPQSKSSDIIICYAASTGFSSLRDGKIGSWYIDVLCSVFAEHAHNIHLNELLKIIGERARNKMSIDGEIQTANTTEIGWFSHLYFNPGLYES